jgi:homoserine dehydrogenase
MASKHVFSLSLGGHMQTVRLALIGFGNVGKGFTQILRDKGDEYAKKFHIEFRIVAVNDLLRGSASNPDGLDLATLLKIGAEAGNLSDLPVWGNHWDALTTITHCNADVVVEISYTNLETGQPAISHIRAAIESGKHVVTSNKGPVALQYRELSELARSKNLQIGVEGTVMSGTPALHLGTDLLAGAGVRRIQGILNGTTNYILTQMESGASYTEALAQAQKQGYAEADPTGDVEGYDAAGKVAILSALLMDTPLTLKQVDRNGITGITSDDVADALAEGQRWKLIGSLEKRPEGVVASVKPVRLPLSHPLASVGGATNAITYSTELLGEVTLIGPGAGRLETGYALICDLLHIYGR